MKQQIKNDNMEEAEISEAEQTELFSERLTGI